MTLRVKAGRQEMSGLFFGVTPRGGSDSKDKDAVGVAWFPQGKGFAHDRGAVPQGDESPGQVVGGQSLGGIGDRYGRAILGDELLMGARLVGGRGRVPGGLASMARRALLGVSAGLDGPVTSQDRAQLSAA